MRKITTSTLWLSDEFDFLQNRGTAENEKRAKQVAAIKGTNMVDKRSELKKKCYRSHLL